MAADNIVLDRGSNTKCTVNPHGATVVSWIVRNQEQLFLSKQAVLDGTKPIRGGIPLVFPHFGPWDAGPQHGFARIVPWNVETQPQKLASGDVEAVFSLTDSDFTRAMWNYQFRITYRVILRERGLHSNITVNNASKDLPFDFNVLFHTYFRVPDVKNFQITGLQGCTFIDKTKDGATSQEDRNIVTVTEWTDRVYQNTPQDHVITNVASGQKIGLQKYNFPDTVLWNPWSEKAKEMSDFGDEEFTNMVCVEAGNVSTPITLPPGENFQASLTLQIGCECR